MGYDIAISIYRLPRYMCYHIPSSISRVPFYHAQSLALPMTLCGNAGSRSPRHRLRVPHLDIVSRCHSFPRAHALSCTALLFQTLPRLPCFLFFGCAPKTSICSLAGCCAKRAGETACTLLRALIHSPLRWLSSVCRRQSYARSALYHPFARSRPTSIPYPST